MRTKRMSIVFFTLIIFFLALSMGICCGKKTKPILKTTDLDGFYLVDSTYHKGRSGYVPVYSEFWATIDQDTYRKETNEFKKNWNNSDKRKKRGEPAYYVDVKRMFFVNNRKATTYLQKSYFPLRGGVYCKKTGSGLWMDDSPSGKKYGNASFYLRDRVGYDYKVLVLRKGSTIAEITVSGRKNDVLLSWTFVENIAAIVESRIKSKKR